MTEEELQKRLVLNLKRIRKEKGFTQESLAEKAGLSTQIINDIEGYRRWPRRSTLAKILSALDVDVQILFSADDAVSPDLQQGSTTSSNLIQTIHSEIESIFLKYE